MAALPVELPSSGNKSNLLDLVKSGQGLLDIFAGSKGTSTETTQTNISPEAVQALLAQILGGTQGLAQVSSGQKAAGMYNSTVNSQLINDLISRTTGEVAKASSPTTRTTANVKAPQMDLGKTLLGIGVSSLGKKALEKSGVGKSVEDIFSQIFNPGTPRAGFEASADLADLSSGQAASNFNIADFISSSDLPANAASAAVSASLGEGTNLAGNLLTNSLSDELAAGSIDSIAGASADGLANYGLSFGTDELASSAVSSLGGGGLAVFGAAADAITGGEWSSFMGDIVGGEFSVICTELHRQGIMSPELYRIDSEHTRKYLSPVTRRGYRIWAIPVVPIMRKSPFLTKIAAFFAIKRAQSLIGQSLFGSIFRKIFEPICFVIGCFVKKDPDHSRLYNQEIA